MSEVVRGVAAPPPLAAAEELQRLELSSAWPNAVLYELQNLARSDRHHAGGMIFREGDAADSVQIIVSGQVALEMNIPARGAMRLLTLGRGDLLGWSGVLGGTESTASARALTDVELIRFPAHELAALCEHNHEAGFQIMRRLAWALSKRLTATRLQLLDLYAREPPIVLQPADLRS